MDDIYILIKEKLSERTPVLFTGVPCQVAALYSVVGRKNKNLYTIDMVCHGVSSYKVLEKYLHDVHHKKLVKELYFKRKEPWGWGAGTSIFLKTAQNMNSTTILILFLSPITKVTAKMPPVHFVNQIYCLVRVILQWGGL